MDLAEKYLKRAFVLKKKKKVSKPLDCMVTEIGKVLSHLII